MKQERVEYQLTRSLKSPLTLLYKRRVKPPLPKACPERVDGEVRRDLKTASRGLRENGYESKRHGEIYRRFLQRQASAEGP